MINLPFFNHFISVLALYRSDALAIGMSNQFFLKPGLWLWFNLLLFVRFELSFVWTSQILFEASGPHRSCICVWCVCVVHFFFFFIIFAGIIIIFILLCPIFNIWWKRYRCVFFYLLFLLWWEFSLYRILNDISLLLLSFSFFLGKIFFLSQLGSK